MNKGDLGQKQVPKPKAAAPGPLSPGGHTKGAKPNPSPQPGADM